jgi:hypothetical protein
MQKEEKNVFSDDLIRLLPKMQYRMMRESPKVYADEICRMNEIIAKIPRLYETWRIGIGIYQLKFQKNRRALSGMRLRQIFIFRRQLWKKQSPGF